MKLSIVVPLYNEEKRIKNTFPQIKDHLQNLSNKLDLDIELIFVNDGSKDSTKKILEELGIKDFLTYEKNRGKGFALKCGFDKADGDYILFMDADISTPLKHIEEFLEQIKDDKTVLIGSRKMKGAKVKKHQPWLRENLGKGFTLLSNILLVWGISDFTCGFKMFPKQAGKKIFSKVTIERWGFDSEVLFLAKKYKFTIKEIPVEWENEENSKVDLKKDIIKSLGEIFKIRTNSFLKKY